MNESVNINNEYDTLFRSAAFGGFNKKDVLDYIERMVRSRKKDNEKYLEHLSQLDEERRELFEKLNAVKSAIEEKDKLISEIENDCEKLKLENSALSEYNTTMKEELLCANKAIEDNRGNSDELTAAQNKCNELTREIAALKKESIDDKATIAELRASLLNAGNLANNDNLEKISIAEARILELEDELALMKKQPIFNADTTSQTTADKIIISTLETRNADLSARIADLEEKIRRYETDKVRVRAVEDSAYAKAKRIELDAYAKANALRADANERINSFSARLSALSDALVKAREVCVSESEKTSAAYELLLNETIKLRQSLETTK